MVFVHFVFVYFTLFVEYIYIDPNALGAPLGEALWKLPNKRFHPEYYNQIKKPISMAQIRNKLKKGIYTHITDMTADLYLMLDNAKKANAPNSKIHKVSDTNNFPSSLLISFLQLPCRMP